MNSAFKDQLNGLLAMALAEIARTIPVNSAKAASLATAVSRMVHLPEAGHYDWHTAMAWLASHYQVFPVQGTDTDFLAAWERLRKLS